MGTTIQSPGDDLHKQAADLRVAANAMPKEGPFLTVAVWRMYAQANQIEALGTLANTKALLTCLASLPPNAMLETYGNECVVHDPIMQP